MQYSNADVVLMSKDKHLMVKQLVQSDDQALIKKCLNGDRQAQFELYNRYAKSMLNSAHRIVQNQEDAKDILQESFIKAFENLAKLKHSNLEAWLRRIVINTAINQVKKKGLQWAHLSDHPLPAEPMETVTEEIPKLDLDRAYRALMQLPTGYRTVFSLYLLEGYDHKEIAEILGISISTSLTQYSRAKQKLIEIVHKMKRDE